MFKNTLIFSIVAISLLLPFSTSAVLNYNPYSVQQGGTSTSTHPSLNQILIGNSVGTYNLQNIFTLGLSGFSTTSADYWLTLNQGNAWSTSSANYWYASSSLDKFSTTSTDYWYTQQIPPGSASTTLLSDTNTFSGTTTFSKGIVGPNNFTVQQTSGKVGIGTANPTTALTFPLSSTGMSFFNTADQTTNYERVTLGWTSNVFQIDGRSAGTGSSARSIKILAGGPSSVSATLNTSAGATGGLFEVSRSTSGAPHNIIAVTGTNAATAGTISGMAVLNTLNQTGTAGYVGLKINTTETAVGSGLKYLIQAGTSTSQSLFTISNTGLVSILPLATPAGTFLASNANGDIIATSTPPSFSTTSADYHTANYAGNITGANLNITGVSTTSKLCFGDTPDTCMTAPAVSGSAITLYPWNLAVDIPGYEGMRTLPDTLPEVDETCSADADIAGGYCTIDTYVSTSSPQASGALILNKIPAGTWNFNTFSYVNSANGISKIEYTFKRRTSAGVETQLFQATSTELNNTSVGLSIFLSTQLNFAFDATDRLVFVVKGWTDSGTAKTIHYVYEDGAHYSNITTPITIASEAIAFLSSNNIFTGNNSFSGTSEFTGLVTTGNASTTLGTIGTLWNTLINGATAIFTSLTTNGTASSTSLVVSDSSLKIGQGKLYDIVALDKASIADATTTDSTAYPFGSNLRQGGPSFTVTSVEAIIASTTYMGTQNTQGMTWNIKISNVPASSSPMSLFTSDVNTNSTSTFTSYTPTGTATIPSGYNWKFVPSSASSSQIGMFQYVIWGYWN